MKKKKQLKIIPFAGIFIRVYSYYVVQQCEIYANTASHVVFIEIAGYM